MHDGTTEMATVTDGELLNRFAATRDEGAFGRLVGRHGGMVMRVAARLLGGDRAAAEDVAQHVFALLAERASELRHRGCIAGWLHRTTTHAALRARRDAATRAWHEREAAAVQALWAAPADPFGGDAPHADLHRALTALPDEYRDALVLHHLHGYTVEQTAELLVSPVGTVAARLSRGRRMLRDRLAVGAGAVVTLEAVGDWLDANRAAAAEAAATPLFDRVRRSAAAAPPAYTGADPGGAALVTPGGAAATGTAAVGVARVQLAWPKVAAVLIVMSIASAAAAVGGAFSPAAPAERAAPDKGSAAAASARSLFAPETPYQQVGGVPEPSALALLVTGAIPLLCRPRRG